MKITFSTNALDIRKVLGLNGHSFFILGRGPSSVFYNPDSYVYENSLQFEVDSNGLWKYKSGLFKQYSYSSEFSYNSVVEILVRKPNSLINGKFDIIRQDKFVRFTVKTDANTIGLYGSINGNWRLRKFYSDDFANIDYALIHLVTYYNPDKTYYLAVNGDIKKSYRRGRGRSIPNIPYLIFGSQENFTINVYYVGWFSVLVSAANYLSFYNTRKEKLEKFFGITIG